MRRCCWAPSGSRLAETGGLAMIAALAMRTTRSGQVRSRPPSQPSPSSRESHAASGVQRVMRSRMGMGGRANGADRLVASPLHHYREQAGFRWPGGFVSTDLGGRNRTTSFSQLFQAWPSALREEACRFHCEAARKPGEGDGGGKAAQPIREAGSGWSARPDRERLPEQQRV